MTFGFPQGVSVRNEMARPVFGDDAFTPEIEDAEPFSLGVRVKNFGAGDAKSLAIESAQPKIVENDQGLLIDFLITGSEVNGAEESPSLLADFQCSPDMRCLWPPSSRRVLPCFFGACRDS